MTRRSLFALAPLFSAATGNRDLQVPVVRLLDRYSRQSASQLDLFLRTVWQEAVRTFANGRIRLQIVERPVEVLQYASGKPLFRCLDPSRINVVLTDRVPRDWDQGKSLTGVSTTYEGAAVCVISMSEAHGNRVPFLSLNTVVHEMLHVLLGDVFSAPGGFIHTQNAEARVDLYATKLWLFGNASGLIEPASRTVERIEKHAFGSVVQEGCARNL